MPWSRVALFAALATSSLTVEVASAQVTCDDGVLAACAREGDWFVQQRSDFARAERLYRRGCDGNDAASCGRLGILHRTRPELAGNASQAMVFILRGCRLGDATACGVTLELATSGADNVLATPGLLELVHTRCAAHVDAFCALEASLVLSGATGARPDARAAAAIARPVCARGVGTACGALARAMWSTARSDVDRTHAREAAAYGCGLGDRPACVALTEWLPADAPVADARGPFERACQLDHAPACTRLGTMFTDGDPRIPGRFFQRACELGDDAGCGRLAVLTASIDATVPQLDGWLDRGCEASVVEACALLGNRRTAAGDAVSSHGSFERACRAAHAPSCARLHALDAASDPGAAAVWARLACEAGDGTLCFDAARALASTTSNTRDVVALLERGCTADQPAACAMLADNLRGAPSNTARVRACDLGHAESCEQQAALPARRDDARTLLAFACEHGRVSACASLADVLARGVGGASDIAAARALATRACEADVALGCQLLARADLANAAGLPEAASSAAMASSPPGPPGDAAGTVRVGAGVQPNAVPSVSPAGSRHVAAAPAAAAAAAAAAVPTVDDGPQRCRGGEAAACLIVGRELLAASRTQEARRPLERACTAALPEACDLIGTALIAVASSTRRPEYRDGADFLRRACEAGRTPSCEPAARAMRATVSGTRGTRTAVVLLERGAGASDVASTVLLAEILGAESTPNVSRVAGLLRNACTLGAAGACRLGFEFVEAHPQLRTTDASTAAALDAKACELDLASACVSYALALHSGAPGVAPDELVAGRAMARACQLGRTERCRTAVAYLVASGGATADERSDAMVRACAAGDLDACETGGRLFVDRAADSAAAQHAAEMFGTACRAGRVSNCSLAADASIAAGAANGPGSGGARAAIPLYRLACTGAFTDGCRGLIELCAAGELISCIEGAAACDGGVSVACIARATEGAQ